MPTYENMYKFSGLGFAGKLALDDSLATFLPLIDSRLTTVDNAIIGNPGNFDTPAVLTFPLLFMLHVSSACYVRQRTVHPSISNLATDNVLRVMAQCGFDITDGSAAAQYGTLSPYTLVGPATTDAHFRAFNANRAPVDMAGQLHSDGGYIMADTYVPITVNSLRDAWISVVLCDGTINFQCISDTTIVGY